MFDNVSELWIGIVVVAVIMLACTRYIISKVTGTDPANLDILGNLRSKLVTGIASNVYLIQLEKDKGRQAVLDEIELHINDYIKSTTVLTTAEKDLLISLDKTKLIKFIEDELVRLKVLSDDPANPATPPATQ